MLINESSYRISGYKTILPVKTAKSELVRIVCLIKESITPYIKIMTDLMSCDFPSIWLEYNSDSRTKPIRIAGFYRVWTQDGSKNTECQLSAIKIFNSQLEKASENQNSVLVLGDANLFAEKLLSPDFLHKKVASSLQNCLRRTGLKIAKVGPTFQSDHVKKVVMCAAAL